jgi:hypothetical protein
MSGASIETTRELRASSLRDVKARMWPLFGDVRVASSANQFLDGLLSWGRSGIKASISAGIMSRSSG